VTKKNSIKFYLGSSQHEVLSGSLLPSAFQCILGKCGYSSRYYTFSTSVATSFLKRSLQLWPVLCPVHKTHHTHACARAEIDRCRVIGEAVNKSIVLCLSIHMGIRHWKTAKEGYVNASCKIRYFSVCCL
jgi:hypothetical protein